MFELHSAWKTVRPFIVYMAIGVSGALLDLLVLFLLVRYCDINEYIANTFSISVGITNNFFLNAFFNFKKTDRLIKRYVSFYSVGLIGIALSNVFLWLFNDYWGGTVQTVIHMLLPALSQYRLELVKGVSIVVIAVIQYLLNKRFTFHPV